MRARFTLMLFARILNKLSKQSLFANLKKCRFHNDEIRFLNYVVSAQGVRIEDE